MKVHILGVAGFDNGGLPFSSFLVDDSLLVECPPDILVSLGREGIDPGAIRTIFVSHCHGDHCFGLPFLLFRLWKLAGTAEGPLLVGPAGLAERTLELCSLAIAPDHPYIPWVRSSCRYETVAEGSRSFLGAYEALYERSRHGPETLGFTLFQGSRTLLGWIPDTKWEVGLGPRFATGAEWTLCDINGTGGFGKVHMSLAEAEAATRAFAPPHARVLGTHLSEMLPPAAGRVGVARPGMLLSAGSDPLKATLAELDLYRHSLASEELAQGAFSQRAVADRITAFLESRPDSMTRSCAEGHATGSAFIVDPTMTRVLLVHHVKLGRWLQPGGHCEEGESAFMAALREAREETGLDVVPVGGGLVLDVDIHEIPARGDAPAHFHYDLRWLFEARPGTEAASLESHAVEWVDFGEALRRNGEESMRRPLEAIARLRGELPIKEQL